MNTFYIGKDNKVLITCPSCEHSKQFDFTPDAIQKMRMTLNKCRCKCKCGKAFEGRIEFRRSYRKKVRLPGAYHDLENGMRGEIMVEDLSLGGVRFTVLDLPGIQPGDQVELSFRLDNGKQALVRRMAKVRWVNGHTVGAELIPSPAYEADLGFYLLK